MSEPRMAVIVAMADERAPIDDCLEGFRREVGTNVAILVVDSARGDRTERVRQRFPTVRVVRAEPGRLVPELWGIGLKAIATDPDWDSTAECVAFTTASMTPAPGWMASMLDALGRSNAAGAGGPIEPAPGLSATDQAIYRLRFARYARERLRIGSPDPSGENAVYRWSALREIAASAFDGFWEVEVQRRLKAQGARFANAANAEVRYLGGGRLTAMLAQRWRHAARFSRDQSRSWGWARRWSRAAMFPAIPAVLAARALRGARPWRVWLPAVPPLLAMSSAWALGEAFGLVAPGGRTPRRNLDIEPIAQSAAHR